MMDDPQVSPPDAGEGVPGRAPLQANAPRGAGDTTISLGQLEAVEADAVAAPGLSGEERAAVAALPRTSALLIMQRGPSAGARFLLDAEKTVAGRSVDADIFLDDVTVSRRHAEFVREGDDFVVRDIGSLNGTYINRNRIDSAVLRSGDEVQIGKYRLTFHPSPGRESGGAPGPMSGQ
ncbi:FHA domain-containing protein [Pengzhenrongella frigida]|uniref:FHA domain-containing protein n=1 Tax=Pengzhenrongella frigida TaxID=1259133 RepID=A0A4Q5MYD0_9MICO|nr:FHA domain-containing protein [Cellulomonas sp. HLT2-17]RYV50708.1 FHA domain-containing protein [Cellulomonas sp. HLT2-17]